MADSRKWRRLLDRPGNVAARLRNHLEVPLAFSRNGTKICVAGENNMAVFETKPPPHTVWLTMRQTNCRQIWPHSAATANLSQHPGWTWARGVGH